MKKNLLLSTLQYIQCFTKEHRIGIKIEKYDNNVYRFIATNGSMLSYIDIDFTLQHYQTDKYLQEDFNSYRKYNTIFQSKMKILKVFNNKIK